MTSRTIPILIAVVLLSCERTPPVDIRGDVDIQGDTGFTEQVEASLRKLKSGAPETYDVVTTFVGCIRQAERSGMLAYGSPPTLHLSDKTASYSVSWCAGSIAHEAYHSKLYHEYLQQHGLPVPNEVWTGTNAERECLRFQQAALKAIRAPRFERRYVANLDGTHHDIDGDGLYEWEDYVRRDW